MVELKPPTKPAADWERVRDEWVRAVTDLVARVEGWCRARDWPTKRIDKAMYESGIGGYTVPALQFQAGSVTLLLNPVGGSTTGADGGVDLYVVPDYDDAARLFLEDGRWAILILPLPTDPLAAFPSADARERPLTPADFARAVERAV